MYSNASSCFLFLARQRRFFGDRQSKKNQNKTKKTSSLLYWQFFSWKRLSRFDVVSFSDSAFIWTVVWSLGSTQYRSGSVFFLSQHDVQQLFGFKSCAACEKSVLSSCFQLQHHGNSGVFKVWQSQNETLLHLFLMWRYCLISACPLCTVKC